MVAEIIAVSKTDQPLRIPNPPSPRLVVRSINARTTRQPPSTLDSTIQIILNISGRGFSALTRSIRYPYFPHSDAARPNGRIPAIWSWVCNVQNNACRIISSIFSNDLLSFWRSRNLYQFWVNCSVQGGRVNECRGKLTTAVPLISDPARKHINWEEKTAKSELAWMDTWKLFLSDGLPFHLATCLMLWGFRFTAAHKMQVSKIG